MESSRYARKEYDVIVVGGGMSGVCAALAAARHGARTAIVQARPVFGGNASPEIRMHIVGAGCHNGKENMHESGILHELLLENKFRNRYHSFPVFGIVLWEKVRFQKNLDSYLNTSMIKAETKDKTIVSISCYQSSTETFFDMSAPVFIDATGHGTLGVLAGADTLTGSESKYEFNEPSAPEDANEYTNGSTILYQAVDRGEPVPFEKPFWAYTFSEEDLKFREHGKKYYAVDDHGVPLNYDGTEKNGSVLPQYSAFDSGHWWIEIGGKYKDIIGQDEVIRDELLKCVFGVWDHIKNQGNHGAENYDLDWVGFVPGYRESRRLKGDYLLTENDIRSNRVFSDAVAYGGWPMDEHTPGGLMDFTKRGAQTLMFPGAYTIPYRCYYSSNITNLMMAGRNISTTKMAFGSIRVMGTCAIGGQAAGTAAFLAAKYRCSPREVANHIHELQQILLKDDCFILGFKNEDTDDLALNAKATASNNKPGGEASNVINGVSRSWEDKSNLWESDGIPADGAALFLELKKLSLVKELRITFDSNLSKEIMPSITAKTQEIQAKTVPPELVKDFIVNFWKEGKIVLTKEILSNHQRLNVIFPGQEGVLTDKLEIRVLATHGCKNARIFEVRLY